MIDPARGGLHILMISAHGLVRGKDLELGRDSDTGGQVLYVVELARALAVRPEVSRVELVTRAIHDSRVDPVYAEPVERLSEKASIVRIPFGPAEYLPKERLWPHVDSAVDALLQHVRRSGRVPDIVHGHYADAGYIGARVAGALGVPFVFTGHSLGRSKRSRLLAQGQEAAELEAKYEISRRIEAEEMSLDCAAFVVASTQQEVAEQYAIYENHHPQRMIVVPPGVDLSRFRPPRGEAPGPFVDELAKFLRDPKKPMILAMARPDEKKNLVTLVNAFGQNKRLRELANLVIVAGTREDLDTLERGPRKVMFELLATIDRHDLYGSVAYPKYHSPADVPEIYRIAARSRGVFVNPALMEPFGLTLLEAAASGLPLVATEHGGPKEILAKIKCGVLVDPLDEQALGDRILFAISNRRMRREWAQNGSTLAPRHYSWKRHAARYIEAVTRTIADAPVRTRREAAPRAPAMPAPDRVLVADIDGTLIGDRDALRALLARIDGHRGKLAFCIATGRSLESAERVLAEWGVPTPDVLITSVGTEIHYGARHVQDLAWTEHIDHTWDRAAILRAMRSIEGIVPQGRDSQRLHKISYYYDPKRAPPIREIRRRLRRRDLHASLIYSHGQFLDILPIRASKGLAVRYLAMKWSLPLGRFLVAGDSGNDAEMLRGNTLAVVVGNHAPDLAELRGWPRIFFSDRSYALGIVDGIEHYDFLSSIRVPEERPNP